MKTVSEILRIKQKPQNIISPDAKVIDALIMMNSVNLSYLVVMEEDQFKGIFSERDYTRNVILKGRTSDTAAVQEVMSCNFPTVASSDTVETCMKLMDMHKTRYLPVFSGNSLLGVVTLNDVLRQVIWSKEDVFDNDLAHKLADQQDRIF
jgi:signal-transduction protein with cAMP-binding, CBS, and nucleotidyltransferase domain